MTRSVTRGAFRNFFFLFLFLWTRSVSQTGNQFGNKIRLAVRLKYKKKRKVVRSSTDFVRDFQKFLCPHSAVPPMRLLRSETHAAAADVVRGRLHVAHSRTPSHRLLSTLEILYQSLNHDVRIIVIIIN